jgi:hypothetical protein
MIQHKPYEIDTDSLLYYVQLGRVHSTTDVSHVSRICMFNHVATIRVNNK